MRGVAALGAVIGMALLQLVAPPTAEPKASTMEAMRTVERERPAATTRRGPYRYCSDAQEDGATPIYAGQPGYNSDLDGDNDGIACERW